MFQSTHPHGVRPVEILYVQGGERFQSTHPHGVRLSPDVFFQYKESFVSIHAPTRGATCTGNINTVSDHGFNPRTHTGCDIPRKGTEISLRVSIHAPTRGATGNLPFQTCGETTFQSTHPHGVRHFQDIVRQVLEKFQSTHPHGVRHLV